MHALHDAGVMQLSAYQAIYLARGNHQLSGSLTEADKVLLTSQAANQLVLISTQRQM
jgi:hypothetical protein